MAGLELTGEVSGISDEQKAFIKSVIEQQGFDNTNVELAAVGDAGDNYVANVKRITVSKDGKTFQMIAKLASSKETVRAMNNTPLLFQNEHVMYTQVLPKFTELEKAANVPEDETLRYAACYGTHMEPPNEVILLEDLKMSGFQILGRFNVLSDENVRLVLKNFAIIHALSYALKNQEPETFATFAKTLIDFWSLMQQIPEFNMYFEKLDDEVQMLLVDEKYKKAVKNTIAQMPANGSKLTKIDTNSKHSVIQQGDAWTNNIMFRLEGDRSIQCCMIDYQLSKESNPVADILYMIFNGTDYKTRAKHYHDWVDFYHSHLDKYLSNFGLKANYIYPRDQLDADLRRYSKVFLGTAVMMASMLVRESADAAKMKEAMELDIPIEEMMEQQKLSNTDPEIIQRFKERVEGLVDSFLELGYLNQ